VKAAAKVPKTASTRGDESVVGALRTNEFNYRVLAETGVNGTKAPRANRLSVIAPQVAVHLLDGSVVDEEMAAG
jgi:hypothetical protein